MKHLHTFEEFLNENSKPLNEIKAKFTSVMKADKIFNSIESALKGGIFYEAELGKKVYMKPGGKRAVQAEKFRKTLWLTSNTKTVVTSGNVEFEYDYTTFNVPENDVKKRTSKEYLEFRLESLFNQLHANQGSDWDATADAEAAGSYAHKPDDNVNPYVDCGLIVFFADKYKINLKDFMHKQGYTLNYNTLMDYAKFFPYKK